MTSSGTDLHRMAVTSPSAPVVSGAVSVGVQSVLYGSDFHHVLRAAKSLARAAELARASGTVSAVTLRLGDSSPTPCLDMAAFQTAMAGHRDVLSVEYDFFDGNLGSARGHNRLAAANTADMILIQNPDVVMAPRALEELVTCFRRAGIGMAEAKQLPIEHPKDYDIHTGECGWATTACAMMPNALFRQIGGFDADSFFLYCDDVDYSWLTRLAGYKVMFQPSAVVFHDKRLTTDGQWATTSSERYYSAEAALFLSYKWSRADMTDKWLSAFEASNDANLQRAAKTFRDRRTAGQLPAQLDPDHTIASFIDGFYAKHRFPL